jgi:hypothetical protein
MQLHERAAGCLPQRIEHEKPSRRGLGAPALSGRHRLDHQCRQGPFK